LRTAGNSHDQLTMKYVKCGDHYSLPETLHEFRTEFMGEPAEYSPYCVYLLSLPSSQIFMSFLHTFLSSSFLVLLYLISFFFHPVLLSSFFVPLPSLFISASPPSFPYLNFLTLHSFAFHFFHAEIDSNPVRTTSVYATPRL
jgi:hypothetical protein